jgi:hypothetical protein
VKQYQLAEWQQMVNSAKDHLDSTCPLIEDEVTVAVADRLEKLEAFVMWIARDYEELIFLFEEWHGKNIRWWKDEV